MPTNTTVEFEIDRFAIGDGATNRGTHIAARATDGTRFPDVEVDDAGRLFIAGSYLPGYLAVQWLRGLVEHTEARMDAL